MTWGGTAHTKPGSGLSYAFDIVKFYYLNKFKMAKDKQAISGYLLSKAWFDYAFENPDKITVAQTALYMWLIELNNRKGFTEKFTFNTDDACSATGIKDRKTIWKALNELVESCFVTMVFKSEHKHKPTVISIINNVVKSNGCLNKSISYLSEIWTGEETVSGSVEERYTDQSRTGNSTVSGHSLNYEPV